MKSDSTDHTRTIERRRSFLNRAYELTRSEAHALALNEMGFSSSGIAKEMECTESTVKKYLRSIEDELGNAPMASSPPVPEPEDKLVTGTVGGEI